MRLSILIPSIPSRFEKMMALYNKLENQIKTEAVEDLVEILIWIDNKQRSIGAKRDDLVQMARGDYLAFVDDDDDVAGNYIKEMIKGAIAGMDVICFRQLAVDNCQWSYIDFSIKNKNEEFKIHSITRRKPFHVCGWKRELAQKVRFMNIGYSEDWEWCKEVLKKVKTEYKTNEIIHYYTRDPKVTEAPVESNEVWKNLDLEYKKKNESNN